MGEKVVAVVSGGMDSVVMLTHLLRMGKEVLVLNFSYGSKHNSKERSALLEACKALGVSVFLYDLPVDGVLFDPSTEEYAPESFLVSDLLKSGGDIPEGHYEEPSMKQTVVPFRNGIMLSLAVGFAESRGAKAVYLANHAGDHAVYPDCRADFAEAFGSAACKGTYLGVEFRTPFVSMSKADIADLGLEIGAPFEHTWTCYRGEESPNGRPCLKCSTCVERTEAFSLIARKDPLLTDEEWEKALVHMERAIEDYDRETSV